MKQIKLLKGDAEYNFCVHIADTASEYSQGLMNVSSMSANEGMIFIFENESTQSFWMKNTLIPLDILFFDDNFVLVDYKDDFQPCVEAVCESYTSKKPAKYVLEVNSDVIEEGDYELQIINN